MRLAALSGWLALVAGCIPMAQRMYVPAQGEVTAVLGRNCTSSYKSTLFQRDGIVLIKIALLPRAERLAGTVQVDVLANHTVAFQDVHLRIASPSSGSVQLARLSGGRYTVDKPIEGFALTEFSFSSALPNAPPEVSVSLPAMLIDGQSVIPEAVRFELRRQLVAEGLCQ